MVIARVPDVPGVLTVGKRLIIDVRDAAESRHMETSTNRRTFLAAAGGVGGLSWPAAAQPAP